MEQTSGSTITKGKTQRFPYLGWSAEFTPGGTNTFGETVCRASGRTENQATLECLKAAEVDFGWHGAVIFKEVA